MIGVLLLATLYAPFTVPTHNNGVLAMPDSIQMETCDPFVSNCNLDTSWSMRTTTPIGHIGTCAASSPRMPSGDTCCILPATARRQELLLCYPAFQNKNLLVRRRVCRTTPDSIIRCSKIGTVDQWAQEGVFVCVPRSGGGCDCNKNPSQGTCVYP